MIKARKRKEQERALKRTAVENAVFEILLERGMTHRMPRNYRRYKRLIFQEELHSKLSAMRRYEKQRIRLEIFNARMRSDMRQVARAIQNFNLAGVSTEELKHD